MDFAVIVSSLLSGLLGVMGFGGGSVLIIYLTSFLHMEQRQAQGINLVFFIEKCLNLWYEYYVNFMLVFVEKIDDCFNG